MVVGVSSLWSEDFDSTEPRYEDVWEGFHFLVVITPFLFDDFSVFKLNTEVKAFRIEFQSMGSFKLLFNI